MLSQTSLVTYADTSCSPRRAEPCYVSTFFEEPYTVYWNYEVHAAMVGLHGGVFESLAAAV